MPLKNGEKKKAIDLLETEVFNNPVNVNKYLKIATVYHDMRDYDRALIWIQKTLKLCPYVGRYYFTASMIYKAKGDVANAIEMMKKAVSYSPINFEAREKLRAFEGMKKLSDYFIQNDIFKLHREAISNPKYSKEDAVILLYDTRMIYQGRGASEYQVESLIYLNSQSVINTYKSFVFPYYGSVQKLIVENSEILKKDGSAVHLEVKQGQVLYSSLEVGDAIHLRYKIKNYFKGKLADQFWLSFYLNSKFPVQTSRFSLIVLGEKKFDFKITNKDLKPWESIIDDYKMYVWEENNLQEIIEEPFIANDLHEMITVSSIPDWNYIANWYSELSNLSIKATFEVKEKVKELMKGNENKTEIEKAHIIYRYVDEDYGFNNNVSFPQNAFIPQKVSKTFDVKIGDSKDISALFVSMAKEAGLDANLVLLFKKTGRDYDPLLPSINFNHCIAQLHINGENYFVDPTRYCMPFSALNYNLLNSNALFISKDVASSYNSELVKLNSPDRPLNSKITDTKISFVGDVAVNHRTVYRTGSESAALRSDLRDLDEDGRIKKLNTVFSGILNKNIKIEHLKFENLKNLNDTLILDYYFDYDNYYSEVAGLKIFRLSWTDSLFSGKIFSLEKRKYPLDLRTYTSSPVVKETIGT